MYSNKENSLDGLLDAAENALGNRELGKGGRKLRSKSVGLGLVGSGKEATSTNRRKSVLVHRSALGKGNDEEKRREARRKSLANRRVSFAPEATLHTWDVFEHLTAASEAKAAPTNEAVTIPKKAEKQEDDAQWSSPLKETPDDVEQSSGSEGEGDDILGFGRPNDSGSDDAASADEIADSGDDSDMSMEIAKDEITAALKPWIQKHRPLEFESPNRSFDPFRSPERRADKGDFDEDDMTMDMTRPLGGIIPQSRRQSSMSMTMMEGDMSMDMTQAIGEILNTHGAQNGWSGTAAPAAGRVESSPKSESESGEAMDMTMDMTQAVGGILDRIRDDYTDGSESNGKRVSLKRRVSELSAAYGMGDPDGGERKRREMAGFGDRKNDAAVSSIGGSISDENDGDDGMDMTMPIGRILRRSTTTTTTAVHDRTESDEDMSMELTGVLGEINNRPLAPFQSHKLGGRDGREALNKTPEMPTSRSSRPSLLDSPFKTADEVLYPTVSPYTPSFSTGSDPRVKDMIATAAAVVRSPARSPTRSPTRSPKKMIRHPIAPAVIERQEVAIPAAILAPPPRSPSPHPSPPPHPLLPPPPETAAVKQGIFGGNQYVSSIAESFRLLSTPTKASLSPQKFRIPPVGRTAAAAVTTTTTAPSPSRHRAVQFRPAPQPTTVTTTSTQAAASPPPPPQLPDSGTGAAGRIRLSDFLVLAKIRFLELSSSSSKRRHTAAPSKLARTVIDTEAESEEHDVGKLQARVAAAACTVPILSLLQHSCQEMRHYIAGGKDEVVEIEAEAFENQPPILSDYLMAPITERAKMENQFKNMKTNARLQSKDGWYVWRAQLLHDLTNGLRETGLGLDTDEAQVKSAEEGISDALPQLQHFHRQLRSELTQLREHAVQFAGTDRNALEAARKRLIEVHGNVHSRDRTLAELRKNVMIKREKLAELEKEREECQASIEIAQADRSRLEQDRSSGAGWTGAKVKAIKDKVDAFAATTGWAVMGVNGEALSLTFKSQLELTLHPSAFKRTGSNSGATNGPLQLTYIGHTDRAAGSFPSRPRDRPSLTISGRFILQLLQQHLHLLTQSSTTIRTVLDFVSRGWELATGLSESARLLRQSFITIEKVAEPDRLDLIVDLIMPSLGTKVIVAIEVKAAVKLDGVSAAGGTDITSSPTSPAQPPSISLISSISTYVCYGERYDEAKLADFLTNHIFGSLPNGRDIPDPPVMASALSALKLRLLSRGRQRVGVISPSVISATVSSVTIPTSVPVSTLAPAPVPVVAPIPPGSLNEKVRGPEPVLPRPSRIAVPAGGFVTASAIAITATRSPAAGA